MGSNGALEVNSTERHLLDSSVSNEDHENEETILYNASFEEMEDKFMKYQLAWWILYSLLLVMAWGIGILMLLYLPLQLYILRKDFHSRRLYLTPDAIVYKVRRPVLLPCFGFLKKEKHVLLPSVADLVIEQGYLQSFFGVYSIRIESAGISKHSSDDVRIQGISNPMAFRKAVLTHLANTDCNFHQQTSLSKSLPSTSSALTSGNMAASSSYRKIVSFSGDEILRKLEEVDTSVKRVQTLMEKQGQASEVSV